LFCVYMSQIARKPVWEDDSKVRRCPKCRTEFGWTSRKHHCRACGKVFCNKCSTHTLTIPRYVRYYGNDPVRVCDTCFYKEKHDLMKKKRDAELKKKPEPRVTSSSANNILSPHATKTSTTTTQPQQVNQEPQQAEASPPRSNSPNTSTAKPEKNQSFYALPPSVRKVQISNSVVSSIFGDDLFSSAPAPKPKTTKTPTQKTPSKTPMNSNFATDEVFMSSGAAPTSESDIFGFTPKKPDPKPTQPSSKVKKPVSSSLDASDDSIPQPEPFPVNILENVNPVVQTPTEPVKPVPEPETKRPVHVPTEPTPIQSVHEEKPKIPVVEPVAPVTPVAAPETHIKPVQANTPTTASVSVESLPSPFAADLFIPPRDGGVGETPKARIMQEKLFFRYVNAYLSQRGVTMAAFDPDFLNGVFFIMLVETVSHTPLPDSLTSKCKINPTTREEFHLNFHYAAQHLHDIGKPLPVCSISGVLDGDISAILDLIWAIVYRFEVEPIKCGDEKGIGAIFSWTRLMIEGYPVEFYDFKQSFENGLIFNAIIHRFNANIVDFSILFPNNKVHNLNFAFTLANQVWGIPLLLDAEDTAEDPDDVCIIIYLAFYSTYLS